MQSGGPNMTREQSLEGLNTIVKGLNIATGDLTDSFGKLTKDGERVFEGVALAKATNPNLDAERIRTTLANLKTAAFTIPTRTAGPFANPGGDRGVRVANEVYQAMRSLSGIVDNKALNKALANMKLLEGGKPAVDSKGRPKKGGGIQPGTGTPVDSDMLRTDPFGWIMKHIAPKAVELAKKSLTKQEAKDAEKRGQQVKEEGGTDEEVAEAKTPLRARIQGMLDKMFPGMPSSARTALSETVFGETQARSSLAQGKDALANLKERGNKIFADSLAVQLEQVETAFKDRAATFGTSVSEGVGIPAMLKKISDSLKDPNVRADNRAKVLTAAQTALSLLDNPIAIGGQLIKDGATDPIPQAGWPWFQVQRRNPSATNWRYRPGSRGR